MYIYICMRAASEKHSGRQAGTVAGMHAGRQSGGQAAIPACLQAARQTYRGRAVHSTYHVVRGIYYIVYGI